MDMETYLNEVKHAVVTVLSAIWPEASEVTRLTKEVKRLEARPPLGTVKRSSSR